MTDEVWHAQHVRCLGVRLAGDTIDETDDRGHRIVDDTLLILLNAHHEGVPFTLPPAGRRRSWTVMFDTAETHAKKRRIRSGHEYALQGSVIRRAPGTTGVATGHELRDSSALTLISPSAGDRQLGRLARAYRLQTTYTDGLGQRRRASRESVLATLQALGAPVATPDDAADATLARDTERWSRPIEPVVVAWQGRGHFVLRLPSTTASTRVQCHVRLEDGNTLTWVVSTADDPAMRTVDVNGARYVCARHALPSRLPHGYHGLRVDVGNQTVTALVISAPLRAFENDSKTWDASCLCTRSTRSGAGDLATSLISKHWCSGCAPRVDRLCRRCRCSPPSSAMCRSNQARISR